MKCVLSGWFNRKLLSMNLGRFHNSDNDDKVQPSHRAVVIAPRVHAHIHALVPLLGFGLQKILVRDRHEDLSCVFMHGPSRLIKEVCTFGFDEGSA